MSGDAAISATPAALRERIYAALGDACRLENDLAVSWVRLGGMLAEFKANEHWRPLGYGSFPEFMAELRDKYKRGKTQLWGYTVVAERLLPRVGAEKLEGMGINKALEVYRAERRYQRPAPQEIIDAAADPSKSAREIRADLGRAFNAAPDEKGRWYDFGGSFLTDEERRTFEDAVRVTVRLLGLNPEIDEHVQRKAVLLAWAQEFYGTHAAEVLGPEAGNGQ